MSASALRAEKSFTLFGCLRRLSPPRIRARAAKREKRTSRTPSGKHPGSFLTAIAMHSKSFVVALTFAGFAACSSPKSEPSRETVTPVSQAKAEPAPSAPVPPADAPVAKGAEETKPAAEPQDSKPSATEESSAAAPAAPAASSAPAATSPSAETPPKDEMKAETKSASTETKAESAPAAPAPAAQPPIQPVHPAAQAPQAATTPPPETNDGKSMFGEPLFVDGKRVTDNQIKLYLIFGVGRPMFELARTSVVIEDELHRRAAEAAEAEIKRREAEKPFASPDARKAALDAEEKTQNQQVHEKFTVSDAEVQKEVDRMNNDFLKNYPALDIHTETNRTFRSEEWYTKQLRQTLLFEKVFLPVDPAEWPAVTVEAVRQDSGDILLDDAKTSYQNRKDAAEKLGTEISADDPLYMQMMRDIVRMAIYKLIEFRTPGNGLTADTVALWADTNGDGKPDKTFTTEELWAEIKDTVSPTEVDEAKQWFVTAMSTRDRLEKEGFLMSGDECQKLIKDKASEFEDSIYNLESLATSTYMFPSLETYIDYYCMLQGFTKKNEALLKPGPAGELSPTLREYFDRANRCMGLGQVDVEVMLVGAFDIGKFQWKKDGWNWAKKESATLYKQIQDNLKEYNEQRAKILEAKAKGQEYKPEKEVLEPYRFWTQMMDDHCEYWDPPAPESPDKHISMVGMKMKGRFGPHFRNDLISYVGETYFTEWTTGTSITDYVFFEQAEGTVAGPFKGPQGYYITRVLRRTPPTRGLNLSEPKHLELLRDDWLRFNFNKYAREAVEQADVKGFAKG